ncbi:MAG TPA: GNAT family N-acetyltransferase [Ignavibacteria bacterium]|nr:GNAT family N-acetyltransferase [Ignavibacteria bacterium]
MSKINFILRASIEKDFEIIYSIKKNALGEYITKTWGWDEDFQRKMQAEEFNTENISIIEVNRITVGTVGIIENDNEIIVSRLYIIDKYQSNGIGSKIIKDIISKYRNKTIKLGVLKVNPRAKEFYERHGFKMIGEENEHYKLKYIKDIICLNCGAIIEQKFCPNCGQKKSTGRYTIRHILNDFFHSFTHIDSGILYLIKEQLLRPGIVVKEYIAGKRKKYFSPFQYMILGAAIVTFFTVNLDLGTGLFGELSVKGDNADVVIRNLTAFIYRYINIILMLTVPLIAVYSRLLFRKSGYNYAEHLVLNTFVSALRHLLFLFAVPFLYFFKEYSENILKIFVTVWSFYFIWTYVQFFKPKHKIWAGIKAFLVCYLFLISNGLIIAVVYFILFRK